MNKPNPFAAVQATIFRSCCGLINNRALPTGRNFLGSGTFVAAFGRFFVATAGHLIPADPNAEVVIFGAADTLAGEFIDWDAKCRDGLDLGYLEIAEASVLRAGNVAVDAGLILGSHQPNADDLVMIAGDPAGSLVQETGRILLRDSKTHRWERPTYVTPRFHSQVTWPVPFGDWPDDLESPVPEERIHYLLRYDPNANTLWETDHPAPDGLDGYSGSGIWLCGKQSPHRQEPPRMLNSTDCRLIGLQVSWYAESKLAKAMRFSAWMDFVAQRYA